MKVRVYIVHKWDGLPSSNWYPWLKKELEQRGFQVIVPAMPDTEQPVIEKWVGYLSFELKNPDESVYLIGHSIGCQTIMRYLENLPKPHKLAGVLFVSGWFTLKQEKLKEEGEEIMAIAKPWLETSIDTNKVRNTAQAFR